MNLKFLAGLVASCLLVSGAAHANIVGQVVEVIDGDTIVVDAKRGGKTHIRLLGIDAPELAQAFGNESRSALSKRIHGKFVRVETVGTGKYGRTLGRVYFGSQNINSYMVKKGWAWHYNEHDDYGLGGEQYFAQRNRLGLFKQRSPEPVPPWVFRERKR